MRKEKGITLIALVITIIVLLILAAVSIAMLAGENGILSQANNAKNNTDEAQEREKVQLAVTASALRNTDNNMVITYDNLQYELQQQFDNNFSLTDNKDDTFLININNSGRMYYVSEKRRVIDNNNIVKITSEKELVEFREKVNNGDTFDDKAVILMNDIVLSENWTPVGYLSDENVVKFNGIFNGLKHKINNLNINGPQKLYQGLFANTGSSAEINSVVVTGDIVGGKYLGAIVGYNEGSIRNCGNEATVTSQYEPSENDWNSYSGGITGYNYNGNINGCYNIGTIVNERFTTGGIVGRSENGTVKNCYNNAVISIRGGELGGICGSAINTTVYNVYNSGDLQGTTRSGNAGIVGVATSSKINNAYNTGNIQGNRNVGGIVGTLNVSGEINNSYNKSDIISDETAGGIVANIQSGQVTDFYINSCYYYGKVETTLENKGPIIGTLTDESFIKNCEWYTDDQTYHNDIIEKTTIKFNKNIDMKNILEVVNEESFFVSDGDNNKPKLYWE